MTIPRRISALLLILMVAQAASGLAIPSTYRDVEWIRATWFGNDWVTLAVAAPLFGLALGVAARSSVLAILGWMGMLGYLIYNYAFYLFGASLNIFFPLYVTLLVLGASVLIVSLHRLPVDEIARAFRRDVPRRVIGAVFVGIGALLAITWFGFWSAHMFADRALPVDREAFRLIAALDMVLMVPALVAGGVLLWKDRPWGYILAAIAGIQGTLYLLVLSVNSLVAIRRGITESPGELPLWATLFLVVGAATLTLLWNVRARRLRTSPATAGV